MAETARPKWNPISFIELEFKTRNIHTPCVMISHCSFNPAIDKSVKREGSGKPTWQYLDVPGWPFEEIFSNCSRHFRGFFSHWKLTLFTKYLASQRVCDPFWGPVKKHDPNSKVVVGDLQPIGNRKVNFESPGWGKSTNFGNHNPLIRPAISWGKKPVGIGDLGPLRNSLSKLLPPRAVVTSGVATPQLPGDVSLVGPIGIQRKKHHAMFHRRPVWEIFVCF